MNVMNEYMLVREIEIGLHTCSQEDFTIVVIMSKGFIHLIETPCIVHVAVGDVTEFQKGMQCPNNCIRHVSLDCQ